MFLKQDDVGHRRIVEEEVNMLQSLFLAKCLHQRTMKTVTEEESRGGGSNGGSAMVGDGLFPVEQPSFSHLALKFHCVRICAVMMMKATIGNKER